MSDASIRNSFMLNHLCQPTTPTRTTGTALALREVSDTEAVIALERKTRVRNLSESTGARARTARLASAVTCTNIRAASWPLHDTIQRDLNDVANHRPRRLQARDLTGRRAPRRTIARCTRGLLAKRNRGTARRSHRLESGDLRRHGWEAMPCEDAPARRRVDRR